MVLAPDFTKYSLALIKDDKIIFSSKKSSLKPLIECIKRYKLKFKGCVLHDKIIGLAAARLIIHSKMIKLAFGCIVSKPAKDLLEKNGIKINTQEIVNNILNKNEDGICPMEKKAIEIKDDVLFLSEMDKLAKKSNKNKPMVHT